MTKNLTISFEPPHAGWLPLRIESGDAAVDLNVSYTPNDVLEELVIAALGVTEREETFAVRVHEEPEIKMIRLTRDQDLVTLVVERSHPAETLLSFQGPVAAVVLAIWRALRLLESDEQFASWGRDFPIGLMRQLGEAVERMKAPAA
jgi:hypothetical protein